MHTRGGDLSECYGESLDEANQTECCPSEVEHMLMVLLHPPRAACLCHAPCAKFNLVRAVSIHLSPLCKASAFTIYWYQARTRHLWSMDSAFDALTPALIQKPTPHLRVSNPNLPARNRNMFAGARIKSCSGSLTSARAPRVELPAGGVYIDMTLVGFSNV